MTSESGFLNDIEVDALTELVNIGVSRAAASFRQMVGRPVLLSVPAIDVTTRRTAAALLAEREVGPLVAVSQEFEGAFGGRALLIFPQTNSLALARAVTGDEIADDDLADLEDEALKETGNVILTNCLATMANILQRPVHMSVPTLLREDEAMLFARTPEASDGSGAVLFLYINFVISDRDIRGYIAVLMDVPSLEALRMVIVEFIERVVGRPRASTS
ncbi:MAG: chemotaxis protein CheX [Caulobacteraceae bacterium]